MRRRRGSPPEESLVVDGDCLRWTGAHSGTGYGNLWHPIEKRNISAHKYFWEQVNGPVPDGLVLDHVWSRGCRFLDCVKLEHLETATQKENVRRAEPARRTHCKRGHDLSDAYIRKNGNGIRQCRKCHAEDEAARRAARV